MKILGLTRRELLAGIGVAALANACKSADPGEAGADAQPGRADAAPPPALPDAGTPDGTPGPQLTPAQLLAPVEHIIVLMMENRSFDHILGARKLVEGLPIDGLTGTETNPAPDGELVTVHELFDFTPTDPAHNWTACHDQWDNGLNDGFVKSHAGADQEEVMGYHVRAQVPVTNALADGGAVCERWFASVLGPTWPNRYYLHCATSNGCQTNTPVQGLTGILDVLDANNISNKNYFSDVPWCGPAYGHLTNLATIEEFLSDAAAGTLPSFCFVDPQFGGTGANDDHPSHDVRLGQAFIATVFAAVAQSPLWNRSLFVLIYDEHGGFFDHVPPPTTVDDTPGFEQLGFRVPAIVCGPYVKKGTIDTKLDHVSVIATLSVIHDLVPMNDRVAATNDISSVMDPTLFGDPQPPPALPAMKVSWSKIAGGVDPGPVHEEMEAAVPPQVDRRADRLGISRRVLEEGVRLGVVVLED